jgi:hypothetical protein
MKYKGKFSKPFEGFLMNDQPFTCPYCGARCEEIADFYHTYFKLFVQQCLNKKCGFICTEEEDEYYLKLWGII